MIKYGTNFDAVYNKYDSSENKIMSIKNSEFLINNLGSNFSAL